MYRESEVSFWEHGIRLSIDLKTLQQEFLKGILDSIKHFSFQFLTWILCIIPTLQMGKTKV